MLSKIKCKNALSLVVIDFNIAILIKLHYKPVQAASKQSINIITNILDITFSTLLKQAFLQQTNQSQINIISRQIITDYHWLTYAIICFGAGYPCKNILISQAMTWLWFDNKILNILLHNIFLVISWINTCIVNVFQIGNNVCNTCW